ncbi:MAG: cytochrome P450 [Acidimicrobiales bacterium]
MSGAGSIPSYDTDLFTDEALAEPYGHYRALRDLGPVVWLEAHGVYAVARYEDVRAVLADAETFCSGQGVGLNDVLNEIGRGTTLMSDGDDHRRLRNVIGRPLTPKALSELRPQARERATELADRLVERSSFDAVPDLAEVLATTWVPDLLGWPEEGREKLLDWAAATFNGFGPPNERTNAAASGIIEMAAFAARVASSELPEGSMAAGILEAVARGDLSAGQCPLAIIDYLGPSLDTTISGLGNAIWLFATHPEQWQRLREDPGRAKQAFDEAIRLESPVTGFTRVTTRAVEIGGVELLAGARVLVSYSSANRDERYWDDPERFDIERPNASHVAFGHGEHACAGMGLARLEVTAVLTALAHRVERFELDGTPVRKLNNMIRAFGSLPVRIVSAARASR